MMSPSSAYHAGRRLRSWLIDNAASGALNEVVQLASARSCSGLNI